MTAQPDSTSTAHHRPNGGYQNPWPGAAPRGFKDALRWRFVDRYRTKLAPNPPRGWWPRRTPAIIVPRAKTGYHSVTWVGHATVLLQLGTLNVLTDPVWGQRASPFPWIGPRRLTSPGVDFDALPPIDAVLLSHNHYDHLDAPTVRRIAKQFPAANWLCPLGVGELLRSLGVQRVDERDWWQTADGDGYTATCTPARHFCGRGIRDRGDTLWSGWTIEADGIRVFFAGDTAFHMEFAAIAQRSGPFDLVMLPIGAYEPRWFMESVHMNPEDAVAAYGALTGDGPSRPPCLAIHWGTFRLTDEALQEPPARFAQRWKEAEFPEAANFTFAIGETKRF